MFRGPNTDMLITLLLCPIVIISNCSLLGTQFNISDWKEEAESDGCCGCYCPFIAYQHRVIVSCEHCDDTGDTVTPIAVSLSHLSVCRGVTHDSADSVSREQCHCHMTWSVSVEVSPVTLQTVSVVSSVIVT